MNQANDFEVGSIVEAEYNSGVYVGEVVGFSERTPRVKVRILAVLKHPEQGDLHTPGEVDVPLFHQRRALAEREVALVPRRKVQLRDKQKEIPPYRESLRIALEEQFKRLEKRSDEFAQASLQHLEVLKTEYDF